MQNAKDSFYLALRMRLASLNPERTVLLRGTLRPGILIEEAEAPFAQPPADVFMLRWLGLAADAELSSAMIAMECEISYSTSGSQAFGGLDRGRSLTRMDRELLEILEPSTTAKLDYSVQPPAPMQTQVFWDEPSFTAATTQRERLSRTVRVAVYSYEEQSEQ
ncbi:MAG: hypothetical protein JST28_23715 [Acidobacteria bacterium]|nr:hypothetical protein [Acidobacteriota bacterium]